MSAQVLANLFSRIQTGTPIQIGGVTLVPLIGTDSGPDADLLEEGLAQGLTQVTEVSEGGSVGNLRVVHQGKRALLLVDGEHVQGGKQNRIFNSSFVVPPGATVTVPVSCVEHGRWQYRARRHEASETTVNSFTRSAKLRRVAESVSHGGGIDADQRAVWNDVDQFLTCSATQSCTSAFSDGFERRREAAEPKLRELEPEPGQIGIAAVCEGRLLSMDVFACPSL